MSLKNNILGLTCKHDKINSLLFKAARLINQIRLFFTPIKKKPYFSIIIPVYNHPEHLSHCIESTLSQTYKNFEVIIVDDCSTDPKTREILKKYSGHPKIKITFNEINLGISETQNLAASNATYDWLAFLDCDDYLEKNALSWVAKAINAAPKAKYFFSDRNTINEIDNKSFAEYFGGGEKYYFHPIPLKEKLIRTMLASHLKVIDKKSYFMTGGSDKRVSGVQDWDTALKLADIIDFYYVPKLIYNYRWHPKSQTLANRYNLWKSDNLVRRRGLESCFGKRDLTNETPLNYSQFLETTAEELLSFWQDSKNSLCLSFDIDLDDAVFWKYCIFNAYFNKVYFSESCKDKEKYKHVTWDSSVCIFKSS